jgi:protein PhnA
MPDPLIAEEGFECGTCGHEWMTEADDGIGEVRDVNGQLLSAGDDVVIIKDLKLDGKSGGIKVGTKVKSIRLIAGDHPIQGKVAGRTVLIIADKVKKA